MGKIKFDFTGEVVVVTGAATGIGRCSAVSFAEAGASVAICDFNEEKASETVKMCEDAGAKAKFYKLDVTAPIEEIDKVRDTIIADFGQVHVLHSNAGIGQNNSGSIYNIDDDCWERVYDVNLFGNVKVTRSFAQHMMEKKYGRIIITASIAAYNPSPTQPAYTSSKIATIAYAQCLAKEVGEHNVNVNVLNPGFVYTPIYSEGGAQIILKNSKALQDAGIKDSLDVVKAMANASAMHRMQEAKDCAYTVMFLASEGGKEYTGQAFNVDSGYTMR